MVLPLTVRALYGLPLLLQSERKLDAPVPPSHRLLWDPLDDTFLNLLFF